MKTLIAFCLRRPTTVAAFYVLLFLLSVVAWLRLPVSLLPELRYPALAIWTSYPDVAPERVERGVTEWVEQAVSGVRGLSKLTSRSQLGGTLTRLDFGWNANLDLALLEVREQLDRLGSSLPETAARPMVLRIDPNDRPILLISLRLAQQNADLRQLKQTAKEIIARRLEQLEEVARVRVTGGYDRQIEIQLKPDLLASLNIDISQIEHALQSTNVVLPGGVIRRGPFQYAVEISGEFETLADIRQTILRTTGGTVKLEDVADVREGTVLRRGMIRLNGIENLLLLIEKTPEANTVSAAQTVRETLQSLEKELKNVQFDVVVDESIFIEAAIGGVTESLFYGGICAILVLFFFLRQRRIILAIGITIPLSLMITLLLFDFFDITFNLISLGGLTLGVGMLLDNAIVVVENIMRLHEEGQALPEAALQGTQEVAGSIFSSTLTNLVVFIPITFAEGLAGRLFRDQSMAVVCSLAASLVVALTIVPLVMAKTQTPPRHANPSSDKLSWFFGRYEKLLRWSLDHPYKVVTASLIFILVMGVLAFQLGREVIPHTNQGRIHARITLPPDADISLLDLRTQAIGTQLMAKNQTRYLLADLGERDEARLDLSPRAMYEGDMILVPSDQIKPQTLLNSLQNVALPIDVKLDAKQPPTDLEALITPNEADLYIDLTSEGRQEADSVLPKILAQLAKQPALTNVRKGNIADLPAYRLLFKRAEMAKLDVTTTHLRPYLETGTRGRKATDLQTVNEAIPIVLKTTDITSIEALLSQQVRMPQGGFIPLSQFVEASKIQVPAALFRTDQHNIVRILADLAPNAELKTATDQINQVLQAALPAQVRGQIRGTNEAFLSSLQALGWTLLFSFLLVYLILVAEFEGLKQPLIIMYCVPLALAGVVLTLWLTGQTLNLMTLTGCIVLVGIVDNDAILKIDFINQQRQQGFSIREAILRAGKFRARPIIINTITAVLGLMPSLFDLGEGAALRMGLALSIMGGLLLATFMTLWVVPVLYLLSAIKRSETTA